MGEILKHIPVHMIGDFKKFALARFGIKENDINLDDRIEEIASIFMFGDNAETQPIKKEVETSCVEFIERSEDDYFEEILSKNLVGLDLHKIVSISHSKASIKDTLDIVYAIEINYTNTLFKRLVMRDKEKSKRFFRFVNQKWMLILKERNRDGN